MDLPKDDYISYDDVIKKCRAAGIDVTWRKLNYYKFLGLLPKSVRMPGDKRGYYHESIVYCLRIYHFLQNHMALTLEEIKKWVNDFKEMASDKESPDLLGLFAHWVDLTYGEYLKRAVKFFNKFKDIHLGAHIMSDINFAYKLMCNNSKLSDYLKKDVIKMHMGEFKASAKEWAIEASNRMGDYYNKIKKEQEGKKDE